MKRYLLALTLTVAVFVGCSSQPASRSSRSVTDIGNVELVETTTYHYTLSGDRDCRVDLTALADGQVLVRVVVLGKDAQGQTRILARPHTVAEFGQKVTLEIGEDSVALTPQLKSGAALGGS